MVKLEPIYTSLHTHTVFCDGKDDIETMCRSAHEKGLAAIGFSSHAPTENAGFATNWNMRQDRLGEYVGEIRAAQKRWEGKLAVYAGLELDYIKGRRCALDSDIVSLNLDYLIGSVHYVTPNGEPFTIDGPVAGLEKGIAECYGGDGEAMLADYWNAVLEMVALGGFDIVGHLDLVKRSNTGERFFKMGGAYMQRAEEAVRAIAAAGLVVEVSTGGINRGYISETYPSPEIVRLLRQCDVPVMISADAHNAGDLDGKYSTARQVLLDAGYTRHVIFNGRRNGKAEWEKEALSVL